MQESGYLHELGDDPVVITHEPQKASDLSDSGGVGHFLIASILPLSIAIPWAETMCPRYVIGLWNSSPLEGLSFQSSLLQFLGHGLQPLEMADQIFK